MGVRVRLLLKRPLLGDFFCVATFCCAVGVVCFVFIRHSTGARIGVIYYVQGCDLF